MEPIVVVGSLNMDFVVEVDELPNPGQTVPGWGFQTVPGGKGANQACAAGKLGGRVSMAGRVGGDVFGETLRRSLAEAGVDAARVLVTEKEPTGVALIFVQKGGQNMIVVAPGANARLTPKDVETLGDSFQPGGFLLLQLETPIATVEAAAALGKARGMRTILDPAPARKLPRTLLDAVDILTPNETEAAILLGRPPGSVSLATAAEAASALRHRADSVVIVKLGENGAWLADRRRSEHFPGREVDALDATAAGDTFNGALAVALAEGRPIEDAVRFANAAAALSTTKLGAQASIPTRAEADAFAAKG